METNSTALRLYTLLRIKEHKDFGTFGVIINEDAGVPINTCLERVWKNNEPMVSRIPDGEYICKRFHSLKHPDTFEITGVPNRIACLFHPGNIDEHSEGCVLVGEKFDPVWIEKNNQWDYGIAESTDGFKQFMEGLHGVQVFKLIVKGVMK